MVWSLVSSKCRIACPLSLRPQCNSPQERQSCITCFGNVSTSFDDDDDSCISSVDTESIVGVKGEGEGEVSPLLLAQVCFNKKK